MNQAAEIEAYLRLGGRVLISGDPVCLILPDLGDGFSWPLPAEAWKTWGDIADAFATSCMGDASLADLVIVPMIVDMYRQRDDEERAPCDTLIRMTALPVAAPPDLTSRIKRLEVVPLALMDPLRFGNPRDMDPAEKERLRSAIREVGYVEPMVVREQPGKAGRFEILDGHHRFEILVEEGVMRAQVVVVDLDDVQARALVLSSGNIRARWTDGLQDFIAGMVADGATPEWVNELSGIDLVAVTDGTFFEQQLPLVAEPEKTLGDGGYTRKVKSPIYTPKGENPAPAELVDRTLTAKLETEIAAAKLPADLQDFLLAAAQRHVVFDYEKIAEFYAHASAPVQRLMERSALVIVDFDRAVEDGFADLSEELAQAYGSVTNSTDADDL